MNTPNKNSHVHTAVCWVARIWSLIVLFLVVMVAITPNALSTGEPVQFIEVALLSMYEFAAISLLLAWRWEMLGGTLAIVFAFVEIFGFRIVKGMWYPNFFGFAVPVVLFILPAILYLVDWKISNPRRLSAT